MLDPRALAEVSRIKSRRFIWGSWESARKYRIDQLAYCNELHFAILFIVCLEF